MANVLHQPYMWIEGQRIMDDENGTVVWCKIYNYSNHAMAKRHFKHIMSKYVDDQLPPELEDYEDFRMKLGDEKVTDTRRRKVDYKVADGSGLRPKKKKGKAEARTKPKQKKVRGSVSAKRKGR